QRTPKAIGTLRNEVSSPGSITAGVTVPVLGPTLEKHPTTELCPDIPTSPCIDLVSPNQPFEFTITVTNPADLDMKAVVVTDTVLFTPDGGFQFELEPAHDL